jgi:hypothetical protein
MQYGEIKSVEGNDNKSIETTIKMHEGRVTTQKKEFRERVQIMRVTDLDLIIEDMHLKHALDFAHGAWIERSGDKLYAVKYYATIDNPK